MSEFLDTDLNILRGHSARLEPLIVELMENGIINFENYWIDPRSYHKRGYLRDITVVEKEKRKTDYGQESHCLRIEISREGLYDMLPKALFHHYEYSDPFVPIDQITEESRRVTEEANKARKFFSPLEQEFYRKRIELESFERNNLAGFLSPLQQKLLTDFWPEVCNLSPSYQAILFFMLPLAHKISGNLPLIRQSYRILLKDPVEIFYLPHAEGRFPDELISALGNNSLLGVDFILGEIAHEDLPRLGILIGPLELSLIEDYLEGGEKFQLLEILNDMFLPIEFEVDINIKVRASEETFRLNTSPENTILGYSTLL